MSNTLRPLVESLWMYNTLQVPGHFILRASYSPERFRGLTFHSFPLWPGENDLSHRGARCICLACVLDISAKTTEGGL